MKKKKEKKEENDIDSHKHKEKINEEENDIDSLTFLKPKKEIKEEENKVAMKYFQVSAGLFRSIKKFLKNEELKDMGEKSIECLNRLMLAQAQECCLEMEVKKNSEFNTISGMACSLGITYHKILKKMVELKPQFDSTWITLIGVNKPIIQK